MELKLRWSNLIRNLVLVFSLFSLMVIWAAGAAVIGTLPGHLCRGQGRRYQRTIIVFSGVACLRRRS